MNPSDNESFAFDVENILEKKSNRNIVSLTYKTKVTWLASIEMFAHTTRFQIVDKHRDQYVPDGRKPQFIIIHITDFRLVA